MQHKSVTINEQGQVVIPKEFRDYLNSKTVIIQKEEDNSIKFIPIPDLGGSLAQYSTKNIDFKDARDQAWNEEVDSKFNTKDK
jgi:AbrB family looped-hinge helix DNA binding protein